MLHRRTKVNRDRNHSPQPEKIAEKHRHNLDLLKTLGGRTKLAHKIVLQGADNPQVWRIYPALILQQMLAPVLPLNILFTMHACGHRNCQEARIN
jgi:hypothetical protein